MKVISVVLSLILVFACQGDKDDFGETGNPDGKNEEVQSNETQESHEELTADPPEEEQLEPGQPAETLQTVDQTKKFNEPWTDLNRPIIIDPYRGNAIDWEELQTDKRVVAIIHKATQGFRVDKKYHERRAKAKELGYKWGSYHLGSSGDPIKQADFYLKTIGNIDDEVVALDLEDFSNPNFMSATDAVKFIEYMKEKTGRYPLVYGNRVVCTEISNQYGKNNVFSKCPLWYARFKKRVTDFNDKTWDTYTIWQFSCEINCKSQEKFEAGDCLYSVPGTAFDMDVNVYNGSIDHLITNWPNI